MRSDTLIVPCSRIVYRALRPFPALEPDDPLLMSRSFLAMVLLLVLVGLPWPTAAQPTDAYDASWYDADAPHVRIGIAEDGVYRVQGADLQNALPAGVSLTDLDPTTLRLLEKGAEIPIAVSGSADGRFDAGDAFTFIGQRNRGHDELWAYAYDTDLPSSLDRSLYTDTTYYWLTWGGPAGRRYTDASSSPTAPPTPSLRDTLRAEQEAFYYFGRAFENGDARYTESEGYYWHRFRHNTTGTLTFDHTLPVTDRTDTSDDLHLSIRLDSETSSCHRVQVQARLLQDNGNAAYETLADEEWRGYARQTITVSVAQRRIPTDGLPIRLRSLNTTFATSNCPSPASTPNFVLLDWMEAVYTRTLTAETGTANTQRFVAPRAQPYTFALTGHSGATATVYNETDARRYTVPLSNGTATVADAPTEPGTVYWAVGNGAERTPPDLQPDTPSNWSVASAQGADYLILTTKALRPAAEALADYRSNHNGYRVAVALVQDVFDEFDYGRPTPIAIRRFVRAAQTWSPAPRFLTIYGDAQYPIYTDIDVRRPEWHVPSFGYSPSDGWFAMQVNGLNDWTEQVAIGRIPVRSVAQGELFLEKLRTYESAPPAPWTKRMLLLAGGTNPTEQSSLQFYSDRWGQIAADTLASVGGQMTRVHTGADTLRYYKRADDALDDTFQDSLAVDLKRGSGWLNYFGHSAAQTWEIVTDPPSEFDNANGLPIVVSLGCRTGAFAGGRFEVKSAPSLGEQLVVGSVDENGTPRPGALNGGIAHFGESALGNRLPSANINDELVERVFVDTMRVLGEAIRLAKADVAADFGTSTIYAKHLLQYGLLGDPATEIALPSKPDLAVGEENIRITPDAPTPSDDFTVTVALQNLGLIPSDSVQVNVTWLRPDDETVQRTRRIPRFGIESTLTFTFPIDEDALGSNTFRVSVDPADVYAEDSETNNVAEQTKTVFSTGLTLAHPSDQALVPSRQPTLRVNVFRQTMEAVGLTAQLDTVPTFDSPGLREQQQSVSSALATWTPDASLQDGTTYYWRARLTSPTTTDWQTASFTPQAGAETEGWRQQGRLFTENDNTSLDWSPSETWSLGVFDRNVLIAGDRGSGGFKGQIALDGTEQYTYRTLGYGLVVVDGQTGEVKRSESFCTYNVNNSVLNDRRCYNALEGQAALDEMADFLSTTIDEGDYLFARTRNLARTGSRTIPSEVKTLFQGLGGPVPATPYSAAIDTLDYADVWVLMARKGDPSASVEQVINAQTADDDKRELVYRATLPFLEPSGTTTTPPIGPVTNWGAVSWSAEAQSETGDVRIEVLDASGETVLAQSDGLTGTLALDAIDPEAHPYLRLRAVLSDPETRVPPNLQSWSVTYTGVPEIALDGAPLQTLPDPIEEGAPVEVALPVHNMGTVPSGEVHIRYRWTDEGNTTTTAAIDTLAIAAFDSTETTASIATARRAGENILTITADPADALERIPFNNTAVRTITVEGDQQAPALRVLSNGRELAPTPPSIDNLQDPSLPFVSAQPALEILVSDENPFLTLDDTSYVDVYLKGGLPDEGPRIGTTFRRISFAGPELSFDPPADDDANESRVLFTPSLPPRDSTYTLKVEARDAKNNEVEPYQVSFRVQQEQVVRDVYPYPNPMNTHTTFAFRVEGGSDDALRDFRLRIYTLAGRLVRELDERALEQPLSVGWNTLRWDGRDADGDRVATGVYLYRVRIDGADSTFEGDVEKVAVIR